VQLVGQKFYAPISQFVARVETALTVDDQLMAELYEKCEDREYAADIAALLRLASCGAKERARHWLNALRDLHPGLFI
jgi:hypothetical protein